MSDGTYDPNQLIIVSGVVGALLTVFSYATGTSGVLAILAGITSASVSVVLLGDIESLGREVFYVFLSVLIVSISAILFILL